MHHLFFRFLSNPLIFTFLHSAIDEYELEGSNIAEPSVDEQEYE